MKPFHCASESCLPFAPVIESNPDVAGIGVIVSFLAAAWLSVALTLTITIVDSFFPNLDKTRLALEQTLLTLSDMQLVTGLATLVVSYIEICRMTVYHYNVVIHMVMISTVTHTLTMTVLTGFFERNWKFFVLRLGFIACVFSMWIVIAVEGFQMPVRYADIFLRACCYWADWPSLDLDLVHDHGNGTFTFPNGTQILQGPAVAAADVYFSGTSRKLIRMALVLAAPTSFLLSITSISPGFRRFFDNRTFFFAGFLIPYGWIIRSLILLVVFPLLFASWGTYFVFFERAYLNKPDDVHLNLAGNSEETWSFGQIMPLLLLMLVLFTVAEGFASMLKISILLFANIHHADFYFEETSNKAKSRNGLLRERREYF